MTATLGPPEGNSAIKPLLIVPGALQAISDALPEWEVVGGGKLPPEAITGRQVDIWLACDRGGFKRARALAGILLEHQPSLLRVVRPSNGEFKPGWTVADALNAGWGGAALKAVLEANAESQSLESLGAPLPAPEPSQKAKDYELLNTPPEELPTDLIAGTDMANAKRFIERHGEDVRYVVDRNWHVWDGRRWLADDRAVLVAKLAMESAESMLDEIRTSTMTRDKAFAVAKAAMQKRAVEAVMWMSRSHRPARLIEFDSDPLLLNCHNGTINLKTGELQPHSKKDYITLLAGCEYDPAAKAPLWDKFMGEVCLGNADLLAYLQQLAGYSLTGSVQEQLLIFAWGDGANGKSVLFEALIEILGEYASIASPDMLMAKKFGGIPNDVAALRGVRATFMNETTRGSFDEAKVKDLTGGDRLQARYLHAEYFQFTPTHKLWLRGQFKPTITGTDAGIWRRIRLIPFDMRLSEAQKDLTLIHKLRTELPGILAWAVRGCMDWQSRGLVTPAVVSDAVTEYRTESDTLGRFLDDCCTLRANLRVKSGDLYKAYREFCEQASERHLAAKDFPAELQKRGLLRARSNGTRYIEGLELKTALSVPYHERGERDSEADDGEF